MLPPHANFATPRAACPCFRVCPQPTPLHVTPKSHHPVSSHYFAFTYYCHILSPLHVLLLCDHHYVQSLFTSSPFFCLCIASNTFNVHGLLPPPLIEQVEYGIQISAIRLTTAKNSLCTLWSPPQAPPLHYGSTAVGNGSSYCRGAATPFVGIFAASASGIVKMLLQHSCVGPHTDRCGAR